MTITQFSAIYKRNAHADVSNKLAKATLTKNARHNLILGPIMNQGLVIKNGKPIIVNHLMVLPTDDDTDPKLLANQGDEIADRNPVVMQDKMLDALHVTVLSAPLAASANFTTIQFDFE